MRENTKILSQDSRHPGLTGFIIAAATRTYSYILCQWRYVPLAYVCVWSNTSRPQEVAILKGLVLLCGTAPSLIALQQGFQRMARGSLVARRLFWKNNYLTFYKDFISEDVFPNLRRPALKICAFLGSTYLYEQFFSRMKHVKFKTRTQITDQYPENTLRIVTSNIDANIDKLVEEKHWQVSHCHCKRKMNLFFVKLSFFK
jgi:hypothetical protein